MARLKIRDPVRNIIMTFVDYLFSFFFRFFNFFRNNRIVDLSRLNLRKILLVRTDNIGDVLLLTPSINSIKRKNPNARIDVLVRPLAKDVLKNNPDISNILISRASWFAKTFSLLDVYFLFKDILKIRRSQYDLIVDFRGDFRNIFFYLYLGRGKYRLSYDRSGGSYLLTHCISYEENMHIFEKNYILIKELGVSFFNSQMVVKLNKFDRQRFNKKFNKIIQKHGKLLIGIHPGASSFTRRWQINKYAALIIKLSEIYDCTFYISGDNNEIELGSEIKSLSKLNNVYDLTGKLSLLELSILLKKTNLLICNETGIMHLSVALKTKTLTLFGPQLPSKFGHYNKKSWIIWNNFDCCPCLHNSTCHRTKSTNALCLEEISVDDVVSKCKKIISCN